jgi:hypothetical protein
VARAPRSTIATCPCTQVPAASAGRSSTDDARAQHVRLTRSSTRAVSVVIARIQTHGTDDGVLFDRDGRTDLIVCAGCCVGGWCRCWMVTAVVACGGSLVGVRNVGDPRWGRYRQCVTGRHAAEARRGRPNEWNRASGIRGTARAGARDRGLFIAGPGPRSPRRRRRGPAE